MYCPGRCQSRGCCRLLAGSVSALFQHPYHTTIVSVFKFIIEIAQAALESDSRHRVLTIVSEREVMNFYAQ